VSVAAVVRDRPCLAACAAVAAATLVALAAFTPRFDSNDDVAMNLAAAGLVVTDRPDEHLVYTNVVVGLPLQWLYRVAPALPWYGLYQFAVLAAAAAAICYALLRVNPTGRQAAVALFFLAVAVLPCLVGLQFTKTAFLASLAGLLLLLAPLRGAAPWPRAADAAGVALVVLGSLVRFQGFQLALVVAAPVAAAGAAAAPGRALRRAALPAAAAVLALALQAYNGRYYARSPGWEDFYAYNALRAEFTDYLHYVYSPEAEPALAAAGWEPVDLCLMRNYFFADKDRFSLERLRRFTAVTARRPLNSLTWTVTTLADDFGTYPELPILLMAAACPPLLTGTGWRRFAFSVGLAAAAVVLAAALLAYYWFPAHVAICLFSGVLAASALGSGASEPGGSRDRAGAATRVAGIVLVAGLILWTLKGLFERESQHRQEHAAMQTVMRLLQPGPDKVFVVWADTLKFQMLVYPFEDPRGLRDFRCVWLSSLLASPWTDRRLRDFGIDDVYRAICEKPSVYFMGSEVLLQIYQYYMQRHYGIETQYRAVFPTWQNAHLLNGLSRWARPVVFRVGVVATGRFGDPGQQSGNRVVPFADIQPPGRAEHGQ
jgi:hypothetical protein